MKNKLINKYILGAMMIVPATFVMNNESIVVFADAVSDATAAVVTAEEDSSTTNIEAARTLVNALPEGPSKEELQDRLNALTNITDVQMPILNATANVDVYIKCENLISLSLDTNNVTFEDFGGTEDLEETSAVTLTVNSSLPYELNAYLPTEIGGSRGNTMDHETLEIQVQDGDKGYQKFSGIGDKLTLIDRVEDGNGINHIIDLKLVGGLANEADIYKATIKFEVQQM